MDASRSTLPLQRGAGDIETVSLTIEHADDDATKGSLSFMVLPKAAAPNRGGQMGTQDPSCGSCEDPQVLPCADGRLSSFKTTRDSRNSPCALSQITLQHHF